MGLPWLASRWKLGREGGAASSWGVEGERRMLIPSISCSTHGAKALLTGCLPVSSPLSPLVRS
jgi:hypothetical protein